MKDDLVFTGSVFGSHPIPTLGDYIATIDRYGTVTARLAA
jgi:hypothetical protein